MQLTGNLLQLKEMIEMENEIIKSNEVYRLTLEHYMDYSGERVRIEEPIVVQMVQIAINGVSAPVCLNMMLDRMKEEVIKRCE